MNVRSSPSTSQGIVDQRREKLLDGSEITYFDLPPEETRLLELLKELFLQHWKEITFGPVIEGAVFEIKLAAPPESVTYRGGYLTIETGSWHLHLCLGYPKAFSEELVRRRRVARASFFESKNTSCVPRSFGFRMWNGAGEQMITIFFPNPYLSTDEKAQKPDWSRLQLWKDFKSRYN